MAKGEIAIDVNYCKGCGYCAHYCPKGCIDISGGRFSPKGYLLPVVVDGDQCTACGVCAWMCPDYAIEVFKYVEENEG